MEKFKNKVLLITGGTGSFGSKVLERFKDFQFKEIRIFSRDEKKQFDLRNSTMDDRIKFLIGDVRDKSSVLKAVKGCNYVFNAAALKQVPSCEFFPMEATMTNVIGTNNVIESSIECGVEKVICLSTDKAAYPINAMGISKALMEKIAIAASRDSDRTTICVTRYGNVMASRGSVIPLFIDQIKSKKAITITNPGMTRFLMSLEEAVDLVLFAFQNGQPGDLFIKKSPACTIGDLAKALMRKYNSTNEIVIIGNRHGEKLHETLATSEEISKSIDHGEYFQIKSDNRDLNYDKYFLSGNQEENPREDYNSSNTIQLNIDQIIEKLKSLNNI